MDNSILWLSLGENCMPNNALRRFGLNAPSTPFSSARCCIEHVVWLEKNNYMDLTNPHCLVKLPSGRNDGKTFTYFTRVNASNNLIMA